MPKLATVDNAFNNHNANAKVHENRLYGVSPYDRFETADRRVNYAHNANDLKTLLS